MKIVIYLGDVGQYLCDVAQLHDPNARLITDGNFTNLSTGTYYTSIADIGGLFNLGVLLQQANNIVYAPPANGVWSSDAMRNWTEDYLDVFRFRCVVENYTTPNNVTVDQQSMLKLADYRKTDASQLWVCGCSITYGDGVAQNERYGEILAELLDSDVSFLAECASSITWQADQILRSDIRSGDIVVWGLTIGNRFPFYADNIIKHVTPGTARTCEGYSIDDLDNSNRCYQNLTSIYQVINFCQKTKATLIIASLINRHIIHCLDNIHLVMLCDIWGRVLKERFLDLGSDNKHPGIKTHRIYANEIFQMIKNIQTV